MGNGLEISRREFLDRYLAQVRGNRTPRAGALISEIVPRILAACGWPPQPEELRWYWQNRINRGELKTVTANRERRVVNAALAWGVRNGYLTANPCQAVHKWREGDRGATVFFEPEEIVDILALLPEKYHGLIHWSIWTGMRLSESLALEWEDILSEGDNPWHTVRIRTRGGRARIIPLVEECGAILARSERHGLARPFPFRSRQAVYTAWIRAKQKAGIEKGYFHALRATCAVWLLRSGATLEEVRQVLGHSSPALTEQLYGAFALDDLEREPGQPDNGAYPWQAARILEERGTPPRSDGSPAEK